MKIWRPTIFDNDDPLQREGLIQALRSADLDASKYESGGGITHVVVPLIDPFSNPPQVSATDPELRAEIEPLLPPPLGARSPSPGGDLRS